MLKTIERFINHLIDFSDKAWHKSLFNYVSYISVVLIIIGYSGVILINPKYVSEAHAFILYYVCLVLLIRFNPYAKKTHFTEFDKHVAFTAGILLFTTTIAKHLTTYETAIMDLF
jgi:hypothetical protein